MDAQNQQPLGRADRNMRAWRASSRIGAGLSDSGRTATLASNPLRLSHDGFPRQTAAVAAPHRDFTEALHAMKSMIALVAGLLAFTSLPAKASQTACAFEGGEASRYYELEFIGYDDVSSTIVRCG